MNITKVQWDFLEQKAIGRISSEALEENFPDKADFKSLCLLLDAVSEEIQKLLPKEVGQLEQKFNILFWDLPRRFSNYESLLFFRRYLLNPWHHEHEDIVSAFQTKFNDDPQNIGYIVQAILHPPYHVKNMGSTDSYVRKCAYAIAAQPEPYNTEALTELSQMKEELISSCAKHQLNKIADKRHRL